MGEIQLFFVYYNILDTQALVSFHFPSHKRAFISFLYDVVALYTEVEAERIRGR